jgi:hypothetical protein
MKKKCEIEGEPFLTAKKKGPGRPKAPIDREQLIKCAERQWLTTEIAAFFRVSVSTIDRNFAEDIREARQRGHAKLRDIQWKRALEGSDRMIEHMSKHYLKQHEETKTTVTLPVQEQVGAMSDDELDRRLDERDKRV